MIIILYMLNSCMHDIIELKPLNNKPIGVRFLGLCIGQMKCRSMILEEY